MKGFVTALIRRKVFVVIFQNVLDYFKINSALQ